jgi:hypothetical protein
MRSQLKYNEKGLIRSTAHPAVVKNAPVRYTRDTTGISMYLYHNSDENGEKGRSKVVHVSNLAST